jgi:hypothetical protein
MLSREKAAKLNQSLGKYYVAVRGKLWPLPSMVFQLLRLIDLRTRVWLDSGLALQVVNQAQIRFSLHDIATFKEKSIEHIGS